MQMMRLAQTELDVSKIALGTWVFGDDGWGGCKETDCVSALAAAAQEGINLIDTAPIYGYGRAEERIGKALQGRRKQFVIATKCGLAWQGKKIRVDLSVQNIRREIDESLRRLRTDYIDLYQCHWPDEQTPVEATMATLCRLQQEGKIRYFGVCNFDLARLKECLRISAVVSSQNAYSLLDRAVEDDLLPFLREEKIGFLTYGPLAGGILTGKYQAVPSFPANDVRRFFYKYYQGEKFTTVQKFLMALRELGDFPFNQIAINWVCQQDGVTSVLVGARNAAQVRDNAAALRAGTLSPAQLKRIRALLKEYGL